MFHCWILAKLQIVINLNVKGKYFSQEITVFTYKKITVYNNFIQIFYKYITPIRFIGIPQKKLIIRVVLLPVSIEIIFFFA